MFNQCLQKGVDNEEYTASIYSEGHGSGSDKFIANQMETFPFEGDVIKGEDGEVIINRGSEFGVEKGQNLVMESEGETLIDPATGAVLGEEDGEIIGTLEVTKVREKFSYCKVLEGDQNPERGTIVKAK